MRYIYGPVTSRRLGKSLGISLTPNKFCSFDCIYCQLGKTTEKTVERKEYLSADEVMEELRVWVQQNPGELESLSFVSLAGSGEPTLHPGIGEVIRQIKSMTKKPAALITNASLFKDASVRQAVLDADLIVPSLDAVNDLVMTRINQPHTSLKVEEIIEGLVSLRREYRGQIWLEVMLAKGVNDDLRHIKKLKEVIERINPNKVQLNSPIRTTAVSGVKCVDRRKLEKIKEMIGDKCEIV